MTRARRTYNAHPSAHGQDGIALLQALRAERDVPRCGLCETELDTPAPLCRPCDRVLRAELGGGPSRA